MAYQSPRIKWVRDNVLRIYHPEVLEPTTYLTGTVAAGGTTLTVKSNLGFSNTDPEDLLLIGSLGSEGTEIKRINGAITAGDSLTVQATTFAHGIDTAISKILFNKFEVSGASTLGGSKTVVTFNGANETPINVNGEYTDFVVTGSTYAFYFVRFYNSLSTTPYYGAYSDGIAATDFTVKTVGFIARNAFENSGEERGGIFSDTWLSDQIYLVEQDISKRLERWSWLVSQEYDLGNITTGLDSIALPSDIEDNQTNKSILGLRIGTGENMWYVDKADFELAREGVAHTTFASTASIGATSFVLTDSNDFTNTGSVNVAGTEYSYTTNTRSTDTLSGITATAAEITSGTDAWQGVTFGEPREYTVNNGTLYFVTPPSSDFSGRNIWLDYYKTPARTDGDGDTITVNDSGAVIAGLKVKIKERKMNGAISPTDPAVLEYETKVKRLVENELSGQHVSMVPSIPGSVGRDHKPWWNR